jgi:amino-acid N-acetyltransferase
MLAGVLRELKDARCWMSDIGVIMANDFVDPPPKEVPDEERPKVPYPDVLNGHEEAHLPIRKACISDVEALLELVNGFASQNLMLPRGPQYLFENIRDYVVIVDEAAGKKIVACGSLHVLWLDMAEIRSMAIHPDYQKRGLGRRLVEFLKQEAVQLGIRRLFTFTLSEEFFSRLGFTRKLRDELPPKVWGECSRCPKYFKCDEVGMVLEISG